MSGNAKTYTVRPLGRSAWAGPGLTREEALVAAKAAVARGLDRVVVVCDQTGETLE